MQSTGFLKPRIIDVQPLSPQSTLAPQISIHHGLSVQAEVLGVELQESLGVALVSRELGHGSHG